MRTPLSRWFSAATVVVALAGVAACGDDDDEGATGTTTPPDATVTTAADDGSDGVAGCNEEAAANLSADPDTAPARCESGSPEPQPLPEPMTVRLGVSSPSAEFNGPIALGVARGEFERENLDIEIVTVPPADSLQLLATGQLDAISSSSTAAFFNAVSQGFEVRWAIGQGYNPPDSGSGVWIAQPDATIEDLRGATIGTAVGVGSPVVLALALALEDAGMSLDDVTFQTLPVADIATALLNGAVDAAFLLDPFWVPLADDPAYTQLLPTIPPGDNLGGVYYGASLLENRDAGIAFARAYIRSINTYFDGDYESDPELLADLAEALGVPADQVAMTPSFIWNWDIPEGTTDRLQGVYIPGGAAEYTEPLPEEQLVDRSFVADAVGHER